eukprot:2778775-Pleurochrysis_carterae.AAC.1
MGPAAAFARAQGRGGSGLAAVRVALGQWARGLGVKKPRAAEKAKCQTDSSRKKEEVLTQFL